MATVKVRTGTRALVTSKAMLTCILFVVVCAPFLLFFLDSWGDAEGTMRTLYGIAAAAPACGIGAAVLSMIAVWVRRRQAVLVVNESVTIPRTGVSFPVEELSTVQLWSDRTPRSYVAMLPAHVAERAQNNGVSSIQPYIVAFPQGANPQPFELAELLMQRNSAIQIDRLGNL